MRKESVKYIQLHANEELPSISDLSPFKAVVIIEEEVPETWQWDFCRWLVESGCRYMMAWGKDCSSWEEAVEDANLEAFNYEDIPDAERVITSSHEDEPLEEVFWFSKNKASHPVHELKNVVILHISSQQKEAEIKEQYEDA